LSLYSMLNELCPFRVIPVRRSRAKPKFRRVNSIIVKGKLMKNEISKLAFISNKFIPY
jgi:hypothetical protein